MVVDVHDTFTIVHERWERTTDSVNGRRRVAPRTRFIELATGSGTKREERMSQSGATGPVICATCELEIVGPATVRGGRSFCCAGCAVGGPCICSYESADSHPVDVVEARRDGEPST